MPPFHDPATPAPRIIVSSLFYYKEDLAHEFIDTLLPQLALAAGQAGGSVRLIISLNFPFTPDLWHGIAREVAARHLPRVELELVERGFNLGFGASHRFVFEHRKSDVFVVMNNDLFCERADWLAAMARLLGPAGNADLVGAEENLTDLRTSDGCGVPRAAGSPGDFVDGSLLGVRSATARRLGLFGEDFRYFYFEDADLVLRYRLAGARIETIPVPHRHLRWSGSQQLPRYVVESLLDINRGAFFRRWSSYLQQRRLHGRIGADLRSLAPAECVAALPALLALSRDHPGVPVHLLLPAGAPVNLFRHDAWILSPASDGNLDRIWRAEPPRNDGRLPAVLEHVKAVGASFPVPETAAHLRRIAGVLDASAEPGPRALVCATRPPSKQHGVAPAAAFYAPAADFLRGSGYRVVWASAEAPTARDPDESVSLVDEQDWLREILRSTLIVGPVGLATTLAQMAGVPAFLVAGAVLPQRAIWAWDKTGCFLAPALDCLGCRQAWARSDRSFCLRRDEACIASSLGENFAAALEDFLSGSRHPLACALAAEQRLALLNRQPSSDLDLSRWPDDQSG